jgi:hypothetical protein
LHAICGPAIAQAEPFPGALAQERVHSFAFGYGIAGKLVAEIVEREFEARGKFERVGDGFGQVGEKLLHLLRGFHVTLGVAGQQSSRCGQRAVMADGGECVAKFAIFRGGVVDAVGREQRKIE